MKRSNGPPRELPLGTNNGGTTPSKYGGGAVYRSLALPSPAPGPLELNRPTGEKSHPNLFGPTTTQKGEVFWDAKGPKSPPSSSEEKEHKPLPIPLIVANAPHTALFLQSDPVSLVVAEVNALLERHSIDVSFNDTKFKWKCRCYSGPNETRFVCHLFALPDKPNYFILDFARRAGDAMYFQSIHRSMHNELLKSGFVVPCKGDKMSAEPKPIRMFKPMALPADFFSASQDDKEEEEEEKDAKEYEPLCQMCTSPYIDVQREGLQVLTIQLEKSDAARACLAPFAEKLIQFVAVSRDKHVRRLAASALASISKESNAQRVIREKGGLMTLVKILCDETEFAETRRQAASVLQNTPAWDVDVTKSIKSAKIIAKDARLGEIVRSIQNRAE